LAKRPADGWSWFWIACVLVMLGLALSGLWFHLVGRPR
jgi:hypothetical protein